MRILVTGGAGFIGSNFVKSVLKGELLQCNELTVVDKLSYAGTLTNFESSELRLFKFIQGDICDELLMHKLIERTDLVVNFAAESHVDRSILNSKSFVNSNIIGTHTILEIVKKYDKKMIQISTDEVYGSIAHGSWDENSPIRPNSPYSSTKAAADLLCLAFAHTYNLNISITRCSNNYGPNQFPEKIIPLFITNLLEEKKLPIYGVGDNIRDWLHVSDHCKAISLVTIKGKAGEVYNIGGGTELTNLNLAQIILNEMGFETDRIEHVSDRLGHDFRYSVDCSKIKELGFEPFVGFEEGIRDTINWYRENTDWWTELKKLNG